MVITQIIAEKVVQRCLRESFRLKPYTVPNEIPAELDPTDWYFFQFHLEFENQAGEMNLIAVSKMDGSVKYLGKSDKRQENKL